VIDAIDIQPKIWRGSLVLVEFKGNRRELFGNPWEFPFTFKDIAIVEAERGQDAGSVKTILTDPKFKTRMVEYDVIRRATMQDRQRIERLREYEMHSLEVFHRKIKQHELHMKPVDAECRFDGLKLTFYFTAEGRIDFRELVKDLAGTFRTRIELRQIGARDETRRKACYGSCGRQLCCTSFIDSFQPITTQMAKVQNMILNPSKLSGRCCRLKCCLAFEYEQYSCGGADRSLTEIKDEDGSDSIAEMIEKISD